MNKNRESREGLPGTPPCETKASKTNEKMTSGKVGPVSGSRVSVTVALILRIQEQNI